MQWTYGKTSGAGQAENTTHGHLLTLFTLNPNLVLRKKRHNVHAEIYADSRQGILL